MYFYLAKVGFEPTPTSTAAPSNTETTVIPTRPLRPLKKELYIYIYISDIFSDFSDQELKQSVPKSSPQNENGK